MWWCVREGDVDVDVDIDNGNGRPSSALELLLKQSRLLPIGIIFRCCDGDRLVVLTVNVVVVPVACWSTRSRSLPCTYIETTSLLPLPTLPLLALLLSSHRRFLAKMEMLCAGETLLFRPSASKASWATDGITASVDGRVVG